MTRGLLWLPLLLVFFWLTWAGWNEFQKLEAYRTWAEQFDRAKYDIYAVLGQKGTDLTWGKPSRKAPISLQTFSLRQVMSIQLFVNDQFIDLQQSEDALPAQQRHVALEFRLSDSKSIIRVPFTQSNLAMQWGKYLQKEWQRLQSDPMTPDGATPSDANE